MSVSSLASPHFIYHANPFTFEPHSPPHHHFFLSFPTLSFGLCYPPLLHRLKLHDLLPSLYWPAHSTQTAEMLGRRDTGSRREGDEEKKKRLRGKRKQNRGDVPVCVCAVSLTDIAVGWTADRGQSGKGGGGHEGRG